MTIKRFIDFLQLYVFIFKIIQKGSHYRFIIYICVSILEAFIPVLQVYVLKVLTDTIVLFLSEGQSLVNTILLIFVQLALFISSFLLMNLKGLIKTRLTQFSNYNMDYLVVNKLNRLPLIFFEDTENHNQIERVASGMGGKSISSFISIIEIVKCSIMILGYILLLFKLHWSLSFLLLFLLIPSIYTNIGISKSQYLQSQSQTHGIRRSNYLFSLFSNRVVQKELKIFSHGKYLLAIWKRFFWKTANEQYELEKQGVKKQSYNVIFNQIVNVLFMICLIWFGRNIMTIGDYVAYSQILPLGIGCLQLISGAVGSLLNQSLFLTDCKSFLEQQEHSSRSSQLKLESKLTKGITFNNVSFRYPNSDKYTLNNVSFTISPGEMIAIVGENGSGKSTLVKCLAGLYTPQDGEIFYDGIDLKKIHHSELFEKISILFQDYFKYDLSIEENIGLTNVITEHQMRRFKLAVEQSDLNYLINNLPEKEKNAFRSNFRQWY